MAFANKFGWSVTRESMFDLCKRRYFYHYYLSWGGWNQSAPQPVREAFKLKRLTSLSLWRGQLVHYIASKVLQSMRKKGRIPDRDDVVKYTLERFEQQYSFSRAGRYLVEPKKRGDRLNIDWLALFEHEYGLEPDGRILDNTRNECIEAVEGLLSSPILEAIGETDPSGWFIEDLDHAEFSQSFEFENVTVYAKTDFMYIGGDGRFNIVDWKTYRKPRMPDGSSGEGRGMNVQLGVYGYYAYEVLEKELDSIRLYEVNLLDEARAAEHGIDGEGIESTRMHISEGISKLADLLRNRDTSSNEPLPMEHFPKISGGLCKHCNFRRICRD